MANIINIDTSSKICSVALACDGEVVSGFESKNEMDHSVSLAPFVEKCVNYAKENGIDINAVSVTAGPGSYTGVRIGLSLAKGLCFSKDIPLITLSSLEVMAVRYMFSNPGWEGNETIVPMMDARRMEVFAGVFDSSLKLLMEEQPVILDENSFEWLKDKPKVAFIGDGSEKFKQLYSHKNSDWNSDIMPHAKYMAMLSEKYYRMEKFADVAYSVPRYLKEYQATVAKNKL